MLALGAEMRDELSQIMNDEFLNHAKLSDFFGGTKVEDLEEAIKVMIQKAHTLCPLLTGILVTVQMSGKNIIDLKKIGGKAGQIAVQRGRLLDPTMHARLKNLEQKETPSDSAEKQKLDVDIETARREGEKISALASAMDKRNDHLENRGAFKKGY
jgi:hypothetical protein